MGWGRITPSTCWSRRSRRWRSFNLASWIICCNFPFLFHLSFF
jgi:hypothetical protein